MSERCSGGRPVDDDVGMLLRGDEDAEEMEIGVWAGAAAVGAESIESVVVGVVAVAGGGEDSFAVTRC